MLSYKDIIIKHYTLHMSGRQIAAVIGIDASKSGVNDFLKAFEQCGSLSYPLPTGITNYGIAELVYGRNPEGVDDRNLSFELPDFSEVDKQMNSLKNMTLVFLWGRYKFFSFMGYLASLAKTEKKFKEDYQRVSIELSSILAMGRSLGYTLLLVVQQANTASFSSSADRENILNRIAMGSQTDISASMIFDTSDISGIDYKKPLPAGQGFLAVSGEPVQEFITPRITNAKKMKEIIRNFLDCN